MPARKMLSTIAKRKSMAAFVGGIASEIFEVPVVLQGSRLHPDEFSIRLEDYESDRGEISHMCIDVSPRGVSIHIKFSSGLFSPGFGVEAGRPKWNHYLWPRHADTAATYRRFVTGELFRILPNVAPNGKTRQNLPDRSAWWAIQRAEFAAQCDAKNAA